jgi:membrane fusion protein (multidrug efflux system)
MTSFLKLFKDNKKLFISVGILIICILIKVSFSGGQQSPPNFKIVEIEIAKKSDISYEVGLIGTVKHKNYCVLIAKARGTIDTLIPAGSIIKKGDIIAKIENPDIEKTYELSVSGEQIARAQYERTRNLAKSGVSSKEALEDKEKTLIDAGKALATAKIELDNITIKAPFDGVLGVYKIKDGEQVAVGEQLVSFYNSDDILVEFDIPGEYISKINPNQTVFIDGSKFKLTHAQKAIDEDKHMCPAYIEIKNKDNFIIGSSVDIKLTVEHHDDVIVIPYSSICIRDGKDSVYIAKDGKASLKYVEVGIRNKDKIEIIKGINEEDKVIIAGQDRLFEGISIKTPSDLPPKKAA